MPDNTLQSNSNEWYTPAEYIERVHVMLDGVDLDPASNAIANETIKATCYFDQAADGLSRRWFGRVFLNPPYGRVNGRSGAGVWVDKLLEEYRCGNVREAVLLVNSSTGDQWFQPLFKFAICFVNHRIRFYQADGDKVQPTKSNVFVYLGDQTERFGTIFGPMGKVYLPTLSDAERRLMTYIQSRTGVDRTTLTRYARSTLKMLAEERDAAMAGLVDIGIVEERDGLWFGRTMGGT